MSGNIKRDAINQNIKMMVSITALCEHIDALEELLRVILNYTGSDGDAIDQDIRIKIMELLER